MNRVHSCVVLSKCHRILKSLHGPGSAKPMQRSTEEIQELFKL